MQFQQDVGEGQKRLLRGASAAGFVCEKPDAFGAEPEEKPGFFRGQLLGKGIRKGKCLVFVQDIQHGGTGGHQSFLLMGAEPQHLPGEVLAGAGENLVAMSADQFT